MNFAQRCAQMEVLIVKGCKYFFAYHNLMLQLHCYDQGEIEESEEAGSHRQLNLGAWYVEPVLCHWAGQPPSLTVTYCNAYRVRKQLRMDSLLIALVDLLKWSNGHILSGCQVWN